MACSSGPYASARQERKETKQRPSGRTNAAAAPTASLPRRAVQPSGVLATTTSMPRTVRARREPVLPLFAAEVPETPAPPEPSLPHSRLLHTGPAASVVQTRDPLTRRTRCDGA